jgi:hypothetical protein
VTAPATDVPRIPVTVLRWNGARDWMAESPANARAVLAPAGYTPTTSVAAAQLEAELTGGRVRLAFRSKSPRTESFAWRTLTSRPVPLRDVPVGALAFIESANGWWVLVRVERRRPVLTVIQGGAR